MKHSKPSNFTFPSVYDSLLKGNKKNGLNSGNSNSYSSLPAVYIRENNLDYLIDIAAPGLNKKDFMVNYDHGCLTISSDEENEYKDVEHHRFLFSFQSFRRTFNVPANTIDSDHIIAKYNDDVLHIILPKTDKADLKPAKNIRIS
jgi:HSP20 family protein